MQNLTEGGFSDPPSLNANGRSENPPSVEEKSRAGAQRSQGEGIENPSSVERQKVEQTQPALDHFEKCEDSGKMLLQSISAE